MSSGNKRDIHSASRSNKLFVELHNKITHLFTDEQIAMYTGIPRSTYNKIKLGYFPAYDSRIKALQDFVNSYDTYVPYE